MTRLKSACASAAALALAAMSCAAPALAQDADPASAPAFQVIRLGDNQMSCEALIGEINALGAEQQRIQTEMTTRTTEMTRSAMRASRGPGMGQSAAMTLGSMAASFIPGGALVAQAATTVASMAQQAQMQASQDQMYEDMDAMTAGMSDSMNALMPLSERAQHLADISRAKGC